MHDADHIPVLLTHVIEALLPAPPTRHLTLLDCTAGLGGHAAAIAERLPPGSTVILSDLDLANLTHAAARVSKAAATPGTTILTHHGNFASLPHWLKPQSLSADLLLADLGFASPQIDDPSRGLSFLRDGPLDMRFDPSLKPGAGGVGTPGQTAADLVASLSEGDLVQILFEWGEERHARHIARAIVEARTTTRITTTGQLAEIVHFALRGKVPPRQVTGIDPATKTFQALRIAVNDEIGNLFALLDHIEKAARAVKAGKPTWLNPGATLAFISFHSLEDRPVKQSFAGMVKAGLATDATHKGKPMTAGDDELAANHRSRSAKLRAIRLNT